MCVSVNLSVCVYAVFVSLCICISVLIVSQKGAPFFTEQYYVNPYNHQHLFPYLIIKQFNIFLPWLSDLSIFLSYDMTNKSIIDHLLNKHSMFLTGFFQTVVFVLTVLVRAIILKYA